MAKLPKYELSWLWLINSLVPEPLETRVDVEGLVAVPYLAMRMSACLRAHPAFCSGVCLPWFARTRGIAIPEGFWVP